METVTLFVNDVSVWAGEATPDVFGSFDYFGVPEVWLGDISREMSLAETGSAIEEEENA